MGSDALIGQTIGSYRIVRKLGQGKWGVVYEALQTSMNRPVALKLLSPELAAKPEMKQQFIGNVSAKANVDHPHILSVYEADEANGQTFFTHEYVEGDTLATLTAQGRKLDEPTALQTVKVVGEALAYLNQRKLAYTPLDASRIYIGTDKRPRLANLATFENQPGNTQEDIQTLGNGILAALPGGRAKEPGFQTMLMRMRDGGASGFASWPALLQAVTALEPKVIPADAFKLSAQDQAAIRAVEQAKRRQKQQLIWSMVGIFVVLWLAGLALWWKFHGANQRNFDQEIVKIPAGEFIYQNGQKVTLPDFWIDRYEVTMGQYAKFLDDLAKHPSAEFDHPQQPKGKLHVPRDWAIYYGRASSTFAGYRKVKYVPIDLNCPVFLVDYWDAYAYAKWKGRRLPTEQEWEKAARGTDGRAYPWGNDWNPKNVNAGGDFTPTVGPDYKPNVDGFVWWSPVDAITGDRSPTGIMDMAGNVSEWTDTWDPTHRYVIVRGGNYKSGPDEAKVTRRLTTTFPEIATETLGFRTVSDKPPAGGGG